MLSRCLWIASLITFFGVLDACLARALGYSAITSTVVHATLIVFCVIKLNEYESDSVSDRLERAQLQLINQLHRQSIVLQHKTRQLDARLLRTKRRRSLRRLSVSSSTTASSSPGGGGGAGEGSPRLRASI
jgi:hypothetical protein